MMSIIILFAKIFIKVLHVFPINNKRILIINFYGKGYGESTKYLADELLKKKKYEICWAVRNKNEYMPEGITKIKWNSLRFFYIIATSKLWISDVRTPPYFTKRKNQYYIQTWHGSIGFKKIEYEAFDSLSDYYKKQMINDNKMIDYFLSNCEFYSKKIRSAFGYNGKIIEYGLLKDDEMFKDKSKEIIKKFNASKKKILLYVPTFRNDYNYNPYDVDLKKVRETLIKNTKTDWIVFVKMHPNVTNYKDLFSFDENIVDVSSYENTAELIITSDLILSDYSSVLFDGLFANIPGFIYASDVDSYPKERGFSLDVYSLPFKVSKTTDELLKYMNYEEFEKTKKNYKKFIKDIVLYSDGNSTKKIVDYIETNVLTKK